ncbi:UDP-glucose 6-dehydrogenase TuaD [Polaribacter huanghezhanensis]|uniref:UDP-glucose dehydrogenase family protein n=1 Tax=Polaribacter huanghezhanensis TaxID=1354726 RepID=UPI0026496102|nr:UDP-glucose/GDP-mannose dehydrogenase family protein [Polaribacter huanghezhanensis]WKD86092.1 UDP-glucose 6-dehydrogenase TuaD [Polaribacter huanghezhanensis]
MNITIVGSGYVGLVSGTCFAEMGNKVTCVDIDKVKVQKLKQGILPIFEPGLETMVIKNIHNKNLFFTTNVSQAISNAEIVFIAVGTPMGEDGGADLQYVLAVAKSIGMAMKKRLVVVDKSTVPVGTADKVKEIIQIELNRRGEHIEFDVVSNPEFLKEGAAINDFMKPDRVVIGAESDFAFHLMKQLYAPFFRTHDRFIMMNIRSAEMTKYAANAMLATKISFMNEIANICERVGADANQVRVGIGSDKRIGYDFIYPGIGYGGTCFPKDISALIQLGKNNGYEPALISSVEMVNNKQKELFLNKILERFGENLSDKAFAVWGLSFKPETDDMREAPSTFIIKELKKRGATIRAYDPKAMNQAKDYYLKECDVFYGKEKYETLDNANGLILLTEWKEFRSPDFNEIKKRLEHPIIYDARNQYNVFELSEKGFEYYQMGKD